MGRVWDAPLDPNLKLMLMAYADAAEHDGTDIWPGWERLSKMTGYSRTQVWRNTRELVALGVLVQIGRGVRGQRASYQIPLDHPLLTVLQDEPQSDNSVASEANSVASTQPTVSRSYATPPVLDPSNTPGVSKRNTKADPDDVVALRAGKSWSEIIRDGF